MLTTADTVSKFSQQQQQQLQEHQYFVPCSREDYATEATIQLQNNLKLYD